MLTLQEILSTPMDAAAYLQSQREQMLDLHEQIRRETEKKAENPAWRDRTVAEAEQFMKGLHCLPGTGAKAIFVGNPPQWNVPLVADEEYLWQLNRMGELNAYGDAYLLTGDEKYAQQSITELLDWIKSCPRPPLDPAETDPRALRIRFNNKGPVSAWRVLEVGIRLETTWRNAYIRLLYSDAMTPEAHETIMRSMYEQAATLSHISPLIWPNADHNHFLTEMMGLFSASSMHPEWNRSAEWVEQSLTQLNRCFANQFTPEGGQIEGCPGYHNVCVSTLYRLMHYVQEAHVDTPPLLKEKLLSAISYSVWTIRPVGRMVPLGDSADYPGALLEHARDYKNLFGDYGEYEKIVGLLTDDEPQSKTPGGLKHFKTLGHITARTGWTRRDSYFMFSCNTPVPNGHSQQDPMTFFLSLNGKDITTDPSYCTYMDCEKRKMYKSPEYHSCLTFGGKPPFGYVSNWGFTPQKPGHTVGAYEGADLLAGDASHENYAPNEHRRLCALIGRDVFVVCDDVKNVTGDVVRLYFHMHSPAWQKVAFGALGEGVNVYLPAALRHEVVESTRSPGTDVEVPSARLIATDEHPAEQSLYLTVFAAAEITDIAAERTPRGIEISYKKDGAAVRLLWKFGETCERI